MATATTVAALPAAAAAVAAITAVAVAVEECSVRNTAHTCSSTTTWVCSRTGPGAAAGFLAATSQPTTLPKVGAVLVVG